MNNLDTHLIFEAYKSKEHEVYFEVQYISGLRTKLPACDIRGEVWIDRHGVFYVGNSHGLIAKNVFPNIEDYNVLYNIMFENKFTRGVIQTNTFVLERSSYIEHITKHLPIPDKALKVCKDFAIVTHKELLQDVGTMIWKVLYSTERPISESVVFDPKDGIGAVPNNQSIDYHGFIRTMKPQQFLDFACPLQMAETASGIEQAIRSGKAVGNPFLICDWIEKKKVWQCIGHEGRNRCMALIKIDPNIDIPVHIFPTGGMRARHLTPEMINAPILPEKAGRVIKENEEFKWPAAIEGPAMKYNGEVFVGSIHIDALRKLLEKYPNITETDHVQRGWLLKDGTFVSSKEEASIYHFMLAKNSK